MDAKTRKRLDALLRDFDELRSRIVGYPCNQDFDYSALLPFLSYCANNVGDPFHDSNFLRGCFQRICHEGFNRRSMR